MIIIYQNSCQKLSDTDEIFYAAADWDHNKNYVTRTHTHAHARTRTRTHTHTPFNGL